MTPLNQGASSGEGRALIYALKGNRPGFEIDPADDVKHCADGYTEVRQNGEVVGVYLTALLVWVGDQ